MDRCASASSFGSGRCPAAESHVGSSVLVGDSRRVNFTPKTGRAKADGGGSSGTSSQMYELTNASNLRAAQTASAPASEKSRAPAAPRGLTSLHRQAERLAPNSSAGQERRRDNALSFSRVQATGVQGSLGKEPDYWSYTAPSPSSASHHAFSVNSKYDMKSEYIGPAPQSGSAGAGMTGNIERILGTSHSPADKKIVPPDSSLRQAVDAPRDEREFEEQELLQDDAEWEEPGEEKNAEDYGDGVAEALWEKRIPQTSTQNPISSRTPRVSHLCLPLDAVVLP